MSPITNHSWSGLLLKSTAAVAVGALGWLFYKYAWKNKSPETKQPEWAISDNFSAPGIDLTTITGMLNKYQIPFTIAPSSQWPPKNHVVMPLNEKPPVDLFSSSAEIIWNNCFAQIAIIREKGRAHLLVKPVREVSLEQISDAEYVALKTAIAAIPDMFEKVFGYSDYCECLVESETTFGFELFPGFKGQPGEVDLLDKDERNLYLLSRGRWRSYSLPLEKIEPLKMELSAIFSKRIFCSERPFQYRREEVNLFNAGRFRVNTLLTLLAKENFPVLPLARQKEPMPAATQKDSRTHETKRCFFCNVPDKELIYAGKITQIIANPLPYVGRTEINSKHVLVVPITHVTDCIALNREQIIDERKILLQLRNAWKEIHPEGDFFAWRQQGIKAGHTVPHLHWQVEKATIRELFQYYVYMATEADKPPPFVFAANKELKAALSSYA